MKVNIPVMKECPNYGHWKKMVKIWCSVTDVAKDKQADVLILTLDADGQNLALRVSEEDRHKGDGSGVDEILKVLDTLYEQNKSQKIYSAFEEFEHFVREPSMSVAKYISEYEMKVSALTDLEVNLPDPLLAYKLLKNASLTEDCTRIVRATCKELKLEDMKNAILNVFDVRLGSSSKCGQSFGNQENFPVKTESVDVMETRHSQAKYGSYEQRGFSGKTPVNAPPNDDPLIF